MHSCMAACCVGVSSPSQHIRISLDSIGWVIGCQANQCETLMVGGAFVHRTNVFKTGFDANSPARRLLLLTCCPNLQESAFLLPNFAILPPECSGLDASGS